MFFASVFIGCLLTFSLVPWEGVPFSCFSCVYLFFFLNPAPSIFFIVLVMYSFSSSQRARTRNYIICVCVCACIYIFLSEYGHTYVCGGMWTDGHEQRLCCRLISDSIFSLCHFTPMLASRCNALPYKVPKRLIQKKRQQQIRDVDISL